MRAAHTDERSTRISTTSIHVEMPLSRPSSDHIHELHVQNDGVAHCTCRQHSCQEALEAWGSRALGWQDRKGLFSLPQHPLRILDHDVPTLRPSELGMAGTSGAGSKRFWGGS